MAQLGARAYDADLGRFISVDPLMDLADSQQMHGYAYSNNNPVTFTDPDGLILCQDPRVPDCARVDDNSDRYVYTGNRGFNSTQYATGSAYGTGSRPIQPGWTRIPTSTPRPLVLNPGSQPAPSPPLVNATVSPEDQALNNAKQNNDRNFWQRTGDWASNSWDSVGDHFSEHWRTYAGIGVGVIGLLAVAACTAATVGLCAGGVGLVTAGLLGSGFGVASYHVSTSPEKRDAGGYITSGTLGAFGGGIPRGLYLGKNFGNVVPARSLYDVTIGQVRQSARFSTGLQHVRVGWNNLKART